MTGLSALWLPILLSAVAVFVVSSIIHMEHDHKGNRGWPDLRAADGRPLRMAVARVGQTYER